MKNPNCGACGWCKKLLPDLCAGSTGLCDECLHNHFPKLEKSILKKRKQNEKR